VSALNPLFLLAGVAIGVPIFLHLFQRQQTRRLSFPALRYLERTEREHAREIRLRQLLLLLARVAVLLMLVGAGARLVFHGRGASHPASAVVIVVDNSMSSSLVVGERRVLDELKALAERTLDGATDEDRFWVIRAGEPWLPAIPGGALEARVAIQQTEPSAAGGDLTTALRRARELLIAESPPASEIHLLSDLQSTAFSLLVDPPALDVPVVIWTGVERTVRNRGIARVVVGGGLPPLEGQRTEVTVTVLGEEGDTMRVPLRVVVNERIRGAATVPPGAETSIAIPPAGAGWIRGYADADPDALRADDRRFFAYRSRPAPAVSVAGAPGLFVAEALAVLEDAGRARRSTAQSSGLLIAQGGAGLEQRGPESAALVLPPEDVTLLPALNRRLADAGIPWRYEPRTGSGRAALSGRSLPDPLVDVEVSSWFRLELGGDPAAPSRTLAEVAGRPWAIEGTDVEGRRYLLLGSSLEPGSTSLPVSTAMLRFVAWVTSEWAGTGGSSQALTAGDHISAPAAATHVRFPSGAEYEIDGTRTVRGTGEAGFYTFVAGDSTVSIVALNPPVEESVLTPLERRELDAAVGEDVVRVDSEDAWSRSIYRVRQGPELWWPLLLAGLGLLLIEAYFATSGRHDDRSHARRPARADTSDAAA
jgi:hypothetical protein